MPPTAVDESTQSLQAPVPIPVASPVHIESAPDIQIPHPFIPGLFIRSSALTPQSMGLTSNQLQALPAYLMPGTCITIASVVPWTLQSHQFPHRGLPRYTIPAALDGKEPKPFQLLRLQNTTTQILLVNQSRDGHRFGNAPIYALGTEDSPGDLNQGYAQDLIREWAGDHSAGIHNGKLGVGIIIGKRPWQPDNEPTPEEIAMLNKLQRGLYYGLIGAADQAWVSNDPKLKARTGSQEYRRALEFAVRDYGEKLERHAWYIPLGSDGVGNAMATCPACAGSFNRNAFICASCRTNLADYFLQRNFQIDAQQFPGVAKEVKFLQKQMAAK